ncbi:MAG: hypothetical protein HQL20_00405 [Candidatus Omnitrophica bacterium]|nr:hypothetical protein [Candidatus Omnitrophota bacterium]
MNSHAWKYALSWLIGWAYCRCCGVELDKGLRVYGLPILLRHRKAKIILGREVVLNSDPRVNLAGIVRRVILAAPFAASEIVVGDHTGLSGVVIYAARSVRIGAHVNIGANACIYDTDFHPLDWRARRGNDIALAVSAPVVIGDDVWIGGNSVILKGVNIGRGAVIGAGSIVTRDVPSGEMWAGNPARFRKKVVL